MDFHPTALVSFNNVASRDTLIPLENKDRIHSQPFTSHSERSILPCKTAKPIIRYNDFTAGLLCPLWNK